MGSTAELTRSNGSNNSGSTEEPRTKLEKLKFKLNTLRTNPQYGQATLEGNDYEEDLRFEVYKTFKTFIATLSTYRVIGVKVSSWNQWP